MAISSVFFEKIANKLDQLSIIIASSSMATEDISTPIPSPLLKIDIHPSSSEKKKRKKEEALLASS